MYTIRSLGAVNRFADFARTNAGVQVMQRFNHIPASGLTQKLIDTWDDQDPNGYNAAADCYYWGHKPKPVQVIGVHGGLHAVAQEWFWVCPVGTCPKPKKCKACPPPPPGMTQTPPSTPSTTADDDSGKLFGVNIGLLVAGAMTAGVGYYGYKKGWFKGLKRRR